MKKIAKYTVAALLILSLTVLAGCGGSQSASSSTSTQKPVLKVGSEVAYAPFEFMDDNNKPTGFDLDLVKEIGAAEGYDVQIQNIAWDGLIPSLNEGKVDAVISAMTITPDRQKGALFSDRYFQATQYIAVKAGSPIKNKEDLIGKKIGVQNNTTGQYASEKLGVKNIRKYDTTPDALNALKIGEVDAVVADSPVVLWFIKQNPDANVVVVPSDFEKEYYGIALKLGNSDVATKLNDGLKKLKANGKYNQLYKQYFNQDAPQF